MTKFWLTDDQDLTNPMVKKYPKSTQSNPSRSTNLLLRLDWEFLVKVVSVSYKHVPQRCATKQKCTIKVYNKSVWILYHTLVYDLTLVCPLVVFLLAFFFATQRGRQEHNAFNHEDPWWDRHIAVLSGEMSWIQTVWSAEEFHCRNTHHNKYYKGYIWE